MEDVSAVDKCGEVVRIGDIVRIIELQMELFDFLQPNEIENIRSMIGETFPVEEICPSGLVTVTKWFDRGPGRQETHTLSLLPSQFARVGRMPALPQVSHGQ